MAWSPGIWKRGTLHHTLLTGCSEVQCKLPLSIADGLLIIDEHKSGSFQILGVEAAGGVDAVIPPLLQCARTILHFSHIKQLPLLFQILF